MNPAFAKNKRRMILLTAASVLLLVAQPFLPPVHGCDATRCRNRKAKHESDTRVSCCVKHRRNCSRQPDRSAVTPTIEHQSTSPLDQRGSTKCPSCVCGPTQGPPILQPQSVKCQVECCLLIEGNKWHARRDRATCQRSLHALDALGLVADDSLVKQNCRIQV